MNYIELNCNIEGNIELFSEILIAELGELGFDSFIECETGVKAYIPINLFNFDSIDKLNTLSYKDLGSISFTYSEIEQQNWNELWESNFEPITVNNECIVYAPFHKNIPQLKYQILIEPKMSFGTGHHETTSLMIEQLLDLDVAGKTMLDMGCGTGILAILAAKKNAKSIMAIDIDEWSIENTKENIQRNNTNNITPLLGDVQLINNNQFEIIIANINRNVLLEDIKHYALCLNKDGLLIVSGFYKSDLEDISNESKLRNFGFIDFKEKNNWVSAKFRKITNK